METLRIETRRGTFDIYPYNGETDIAKLRKEGGYDEIVRVPTRIPAGKTVGESIKNYDDKRDCWVVTDEQLNFWSLDNKGNLVYLGNQSNDRLVLTRESGLQTVLYCGDKLKVHEERSR